MGKTPHFHVFSYASCVDLTQLLSQPNASWRTLLPFFYPFFFFFFLRFLFSFQTRAWSIELVNSQLKRCRVLCESDVLCGIYTVRDASSKSLLFLARG